LSEIVVSLTTSSTEIQIRETDPQACSRKVVKVVGFRRKTGPPSA